MDRARAIYDLRPRDLNLDDWFAGSSEQQLFGSVDEVAAALRPYAEAGADRLMLMHSQHTDLDSITLIGEHLASSARALSRMRALPVLEAFTCVWA